MRTYKCKFCETVAKSMTVLKRHASDVHRKESSELKEYLDAVDTKLQSLSEASPVYGNDETEVTNHKRSNKKPPTRFLEIQR
jgi:hypothetical protein